MRGLKKAGQHPLNSRKGGHLGRETASMELLLLLGHTANATITPEPQQAALETQDFGTSWCIQAAGTKLPQAQLKGWGNPSFLCHPRAADRRRLGSCWEEQPMPTCGTVSWCSSMLEAASLRFSALNLCPLSSVSVMAAKS